jgi:hypothetical protein
MAERGEADLTPVTSTGTGSTPRRRRDLLTQVVFSEYRMKITLILLLIAGAFVGLAACSDYKLENRPTVVFSGRGGDKAHITPYPMSERAASIWKSDSCWRGCGANCAAQFNSCGRANGPEACRNALDRCDRICVYQCRNGGGPLLYSFE